MLNPFNNKIVVSKSKRYKYKTIMEAINSAAAGSKIYIEEGVYNESLTFSKDIILIGEGNGENIIINGGENSTLVISEMTVQIEGITIVNSGTIAAIQVKSKGKAKITNCTITSEKSNGILFTNSSEGSLIDHCIIKNTGSNSIVISGNSNPIISNCKIFNSKATGIWVKEKGKGHILYSEIFGNKNANICIETEGNPTIEHCKIYKGESYGVWVKEKGKGQIFNSEIYGNTHPNIGIETEGNPTIEHCKIYQGPNGITVREKGKGKILHSEIYENTRPNIAIITEGNPIIEHCKIYKSESYGVWVKEKGKGQIFNSEIYDNTYPNIGIETEGNPIINYCKIYKGSNGIKVEEKGEGRILNSEIYENTAPNIVITTEGNPTIEHCKIYKGPNGIIVKEKGKGRILHSEIYENTAPSIVIKTEGNPTIEHCKIYEGEQNGIWVLEKGKGHILRSEIFGNKYPNIHITTEGNPTIEHCKLYQGPHGILVETKGKGQILNSEIYENIHPNIVIKTEGNLIIERCKIYKGESYGVWVKEKGKGQILHSEIFDNTFHSQIHLESNSELELTNSKVCNGGEYGIYIENSILNMGNNILSNHSKMDIYQDEQSKVLTIVPNDTPQVMEGSEISKEKAPEVKQSMMSALEQLNNMFGLADLKKQINRFINTVKFNKKREEQGLQTTPITLHSLFLGNPGTGKTTVARLLGKVLFEENVIQEEKFVEVSRKDLVAQYIGHTAKKTQEVLEQARGGVLFIDEAYSLYKDSENDFGSEAIDTILKFMEDYRDEIMIVFAGYTNEMQTFLSMNSGLESRIPNRFDFDDYSPEEIGEIGYAELISQDYFVNEQKYKEIVMNQYARSVDQSNARWVRNFNQKLKMIMADRVIETGESDSQSILEVDLYNAVGQRQENKEEKIQELLEELNNLTGLDIIKQYVQRLVKQVKLDKLLMEQGDMSLNPTYHMIFEGNPGTGKTTVARILSSLFYYLDILPTQNVKFVDRSDLVGSYIGHTEKNTKEVLKQAMGGVLFIDEAYQLTNGSTNDFGKQAVETLLTYLENYRDKFIVILAGYTNEMENFLDTNPGLRSRIPEKIVFPDYSPEEIAVIVENNITKNWTVDTEYLRQAVLRIYSEVPQNEKSNARWARNFSEKLIQNHKVWVIDNGVTGEQLKTIKNSVINQM